VSEAGQEISIKMRYQLVASHFFFFTKFQENINSKYIWVQRAGIRAYGQSDELISSYTYMPVTKHYIYKLVESVLFLNKSMLSVADFTSTSEVCGAENWDKYGWTCKGIRMKPVTSLLSQRAFVQQISISILAVASRWFKIGHCHLHNPL
jgi:hypothetical protein